MRQENDRTVIGRLGRLISSVVGFAVIGLLVVILVAVGKPIVAARIQQAKAPGNATTEVASISPVPAIPTPEAIRASASGPSPSVTPGPTATGAWIRLSPDSGPPGTVVEIDGYLPNAPTVTPKTTFYPGTICWGQCPGGLQYEAVDIQLSTSEPRYFTARFAVPAAPWLDANGIHALTSGTYSVGIQCLDLPMPLKKGPGFVPCGQRPAQATTTFRLTDATSTTCASGPCARLSLSPTQGPPGTLVRMTGWAPLTNPIIGGRSSGYSVVLQRPGESPDDPWLGQVQQAPDGTITGSFRVPVAFDSHSLLTPGSYLLSLQTLVNGAPVSPIQPAPGLTITTWSKGSNVLGTRVTLAPMTFTVTAAPSWASLGQLAPLRSRWSARFYGGPALVGDPTNPQRVAYCTTGQIRVSSDGGKTWSTVPTSGAAQAVAPTPFQFFRNGEVPATCSAVLLDPTHPHSFYATFAVVKKPQGEPPPENLIGLVTTDDGQSWQIVPAPPGYSLDGFGGFQMSDQVVKVLFADHTAPSTPALFAAEQTTDGGRSWAPSQLDCPAGGSCVRWGPAPSIIGGMGANYPQPLEVSTDQGQTWSPPSWPTQVDLRFAPSGLVTLSPSTIALISGNSPYPFLVSHDGGQTWEDVALPLLDAASNGVSQYPGLQLLPNGNLLAQGDQSHGWLMLASGASHWCEVTGAALPSSVNAFWAIGDRIWWLQTDGTPMEPRTVGSVAVTDLQCGQAVPTEDLAPAASTTTTGLGLAPASALRAVLDSPEVEGSSRFALFPRRITKQPCTIHGGGGPAPRTPIPGTCVTEVQVKGSLDEVDFVEIWDAKDFHAAKDPVNGWLSHTWTFVVNGQGKVVKRAEAGNSPPQDVK